MKKYSILMLLLVLSSLSFAFKKETVKLGRVDLVDIVIDRKDEGKRDMRAYLVNVSDVDLALVEFKVEFMDQKAGKYTGVAFKTVRNLKKGKKEKTKLVLDVDKIDGRDFRVVLLNAFTEKELKEYLEKQEKDKDKKDNKKKSEDYYF